MLYVKPAILMASILYQAALQYLYLLKGMPMKTLLIIALCLIFSITSAHANDIVNPSFEDGWQGWTKIDPKDNALGISKEANTGDKSAKITKKTGYFAQYVAVTPNTNYELSAYIKGSGVLAAKAGKEVFFERQKKNKDWKKVSLSFNSNSATKVAIFAQFNGKKSFFDDFSLTSLASDVEITSTSIKVGYKGLSPERTPGENFELIDWNLSLPFDEDGDGKADNISERQLAKGYQRKPYFYTADDGGMVFHAPNVGMKTSKNTKYTRSELREMLRRGNESILVKGKNGVTSANNWVFSSAPQATQKKAGGIDGTLFATLAVNHVSTTGDPKKLGRVVIGQIHAKDNEPIRIYYRKLPNHKKGSIYVAHEPVDGYGKEQWQEVVGSKSSSADDPEDGIALDEKFSYEIITKGYSLIAVFTKADGTEFGRAEFDMTHSGFDKGDDYMYFKAGVYNQNNGGEPGDYVKATFYELKNTHTGYHY